MRTILCGAGLALLCLCTSALAAPEPRAFTEIRVEGNERFRDGDVLATSGLETGVVLDESDLRSAAEALELTGEFTDVRITSSGNVLTITVSEQPEYTGGLTLGLGYDSDVGVLGVLAFRLDDVHGPGTQYLGSLFIAEEAQTLSFGYRSSRFWGQDRSGGIRFGYERYDYDEDAFEYTIAKVEPYYNFSLTPNIAAEARYTLSSDEIKNVTSDASAILQDEAGSRTSSGVGFSLITGSKLSGRGGINGAEWSLRLDQDFTGLGGSTNLSTTKAKFFGKLPLGQSGYAVRTRVEVGTVTGYSDDDPVATDRFFLGGSSLRGFERGTVSPRDVCFGCGSGGSDEVTNLGGNSFAVIRTDLIIPLFRQQPLVETFIFGDVGTSWGIDNNVAPSGTLFKDSEWRSSFGIGGSLETQLGTFETYLALATNGERFDEEQKFGITFRSEF